MTTILITAHSNDPSLVSVMRDLAQRTKGRFYNVTNPRALPRIYQKEARTISRPLIFEQQTPLGAAAEQPDHRAGDGHLADELPPITGLVLTSPKENELVEIPIVSPLPTGQVNPVLAHWTYGLGRSVAFTSDAGRRWAKAWPDWQSYAAFWSQVVRWAMRPAEHGNLTLYGPPRRGADQGRRRCARQGEPVPQLPADPGERRRPRPQAVADRARPDVAGTVRGDGRERRGQRQLLREPRLSRPRQDPGRDLHGRLRPVLRRVPRAAVEPDHAGDPGQPHRRPGRDLEDHGRRPDRPAPDARRGRPFPPRPRPDQSPVVRGALADLALAGGLPVPGRCGRPQDRPGYGPDQAGDGQRMEEAARPGGRAEQRLHGQAAGPARPRSASSSTGPASRPGSRRRRPPTRDRGDRRRDRRAAARGRPARRARRGPPRPAAPRRRRGPRPRRARGRRRPATPTACSRPSSGSGKSATREKRTSAIRGPGRESRQASASADAVGIPARPRETIKLENITHSHERIAVRWPKRPQSRWKPAPRSSGRGTTR